MVAVQQQSAVQQFFAPLAQYLPFAAPDAEQVSKQEAKMVSAVENRAAFAKTLVTKQYETQKSVAALESERSEELMVASITAQRDQKLMALEQSFTQQKLALENERAQAKAALEQQALALGAQAEQARLAAELQAKVTGLPVPAQLDAAKVGEQKAQQLKVIEKRAAAALERVSAQYETQKELVTLDAQRQVDLVKSQVSAQRKQGELALDRRFQEQSMTLEQEQRLATSQLRQTAMSLTAQAEQSKLQRDLAEKMMKQGVPAFGYAQPMSYPVYAQAPVRVAQD